MIEITQKHKCCGCAGCQSICPHGCITMQSDDEGFAYPLVDKARCTNCGLCARACPILNRKTCTNQMKAYAAINNDQQIRLQSSSGGVFSALAECVLAQGGVVFGAAFDENFVVRHMACKSLEDLPKLRTSKYVQSSIGECFKQAKMFLAQGRLVYFTGTPCQIAGLKSFLIRDYENLITQDIICHGVPSPLVWQKYLEYKSKGLKPANVNFRDKSYSWENFAFRIDNKDNIYIKPHLQDKFMRMFLLNKILRPSCHKCAFKGDGHLADITLADFWGKNIKLVPQFNDNKGCNLILTRTQKGEEILNLAKTKITFAPVPVDKALNGNAMYFKSASAFLRPKNFGQHLSTLPFEKFVKKYGWFI